LVAAERQADSSRHNHQPLPPALRRGGLPRIRLHDVRHSYATAALKAGIPAKVISERLGHATAAFTLQTYTHVIPGMDESAASTVAELILGRSGGSEPTDVHGSVHAESLAVLEKQSAAGTAAADVRSGGSVLVQDIPD
jgi:hypothetical protein